jgi:Cu2+-containing amine oxidase
LQALRQRPTGARAVFPSLVQSILYEGSVSEMFVPSDPGEGWFARTFFDIGENNDGFSSSLEIGADCPENAGYFDQVYADRKTRT